MSLGVFTSISVKSFQKLRRIDDEYLNLSTGQLNSLNFLQDKKLLSSLRKLKLNSLICFHFLNVLGYIIAACTPHTGRTPLIGFFSSDVWFSCVGDVFMLIKKISDTPECFALSERKPELCSREGELWCVDSYPHPTRLFFISNLYIFFCMKFFQIFFRHRKKKEESNVVNLCWCGCSGSVSVPDRARRRRETSAPCLCGKN